MRVAVQWLGVAVVGAALGPACSSEKDRSTTPVEINRITPSPSGGAAGGEPVTQTAGAGGSNGGEGPREQAGAAGEAGMGGSGGEGGFGGEGGTDPCSGDYVCPSVGYYGTTMLTVDLPISVAEAADAVFTACRNDQCYSGKGSAKIGNSTTWMEASGGPITLRFDGSGASPFMVLMWAILPTKSETDHYSLTVRRTEAEAPTTLFNDQVTYEIESADPSLVDEGFCRHCSEVPMATVDARTTH